MKVLAILYDGGKAAEEEPRLLGTTENKLGIADWLKERGHELIVTSDKEGPDSVFQKELPEAEVLITTPFHPGYLTADLIKNKAPKLKLCITAGVGSDHVDLNAANENKITVAEVSGSNVVSVAEHVIMDILLLVRNFVPAHEMIERGDWNVSQIARNAFDLEGKVVGTIGAGRIGYRVLERLVPFNCKELLYFDYNALPDDAAKAVKARRVENIEEFVAQCDVVTVNAPLHEGTRGLINANLLKHFKKGAWIVNTARGAIVDRHDLAAALKSGHINGYAGDVWDVQPAPKDHPWRTVKNVLGGGNGMVPHYSGTTLDAQLRYAQGTKSILENYLDGKPQDPSNLIVEGGQYATRNYGQHGGGARGLSSLIVLQEVMHRLRGLKQNGEPLIPADHFDYIAGSGTGGISACMLGKLRMPIDKAIEEYEKLMKNVFTKKKVLGSTAYKAKRLQKALGTMVREATGNAEERMLGKEGDDEKCKTAVFAMAKKNMNACLPVIFRSYRVDADPSPDCTIWEALHATMAHPDLFKSIDIGDLSLKQSFVGGEIGCSNPTGQVLAEIKRLYPNRHVACILSVGAGHARTIQVPDPSLVQKLFRTQDVVAMKQMATDSERVAEEMGARFKTISGVYFRFNVDQGMQSVFSESWEQRSDVLGHTKSYLRKSEVRGTMERAIQSISERRTIISTKLIDGHIQGEAVKRPTRLKRCPAPSPVYTGRDTECEQLEKCLSRNDEERCICVVYGLGGVGKTQLILNVIERTRDMWDCVIYVDANSEAAIKSTLQDFAVVKGIGETYEDAIGWLESSHERWLLVLDNADDQALVTRIRQYLPGGRRGKIIITTRLADLAVLAKGAGSSCHLSSMSQEDGMKLLVKTARKEGQTLSGAEMEAAIALLQDFGCLALAIVHAGAYMRRRNVSIAKYRGLYLSGCRDILEHSGKLHENIDDYGKPVYMTWNLNYGLLQEPSKQMLWLMAFLHYDHIHEDLFKRATRNILIHRYSQPTPLTEVELVARTSLMEYLSTFLGSEGCWDTTKFANIISDLTSCSLVHFDHMNLTYGVHVLVQDWVRIMIPQTPEIALECTATLLSASMIDLQDDAESFLFERQLGLHVNNMIERKHEVGASHAHGFSYICLRMGQWYQAEQLAKRSLDTYKLSLGEEDPITWSSMKYLALISRSLGRPNEAEKLVVEALNACKRVLGEDNELALELRSSLSIIYVELGRLDEAKDIQIQVLQTRMQYLDEEHPALLNSMDELAQTYSLLAQWDKAEELWASALTSRERLGSEHPDILDTMSHLALGYSFLGRHDEAKQLQSRILNAHKQPLAEGYPRMLKSIRTLALGCTILGQWGQAEHLQTQVMDASKQLLGEEHPDTLKSMQHAAVIYAHLGRGSEAQLLLAKIINISERKLGKNHPDTRMYRVYSIYVWELGALASLKRNRTRVFAYMLILLFLSIGLHFV